MLSFLKKPAFHFKSQLYCLLLGIVTISFGCEKVSTDGCVTVKEYAGFVEATGYLTEAEKIGTGFVVENVFQFREVPGANWRKPDGENSADPSLPVTQVSYNDALAFCKWAKKSLYKENEWWEKAGHDTRMKNYASTKIIVDEMVNLIGNTWEWTAEILTDQVGTPYAHAVGGSYLCEANTCEGYKKENWRELSLDSASDIVSFRVK